MAYIVSEGGAFDERMPDLYRIIMYTHVCEKKGPASAASASALEVASVFLGICRFVSVLFMLWEQTGELKDLNLAAVRL